MMSWLSANLSTVLISVILVAIVICIILVMRRDKKKGKSTCGGNCGHCPMGGSCHKQQ